jgi:hypothetical protein
MGLCCLEDLVQHRGKQPSSCAEPWMNYRDSLDAGDSLGRSPVADNGKPDGGSIYFSKEISEAAILEGSKMALPVPTANQVFVARLPLRRHDEGHIVRSGAADAEGVHVLSIAPFDERRKSKSLSNY